MGISQNKGYVSDSYFARQNKCQLLPTLKLARTEEKKLNNAGKLRRRNIKAKMLAWRAGMARRSEFPANVMTTES
jgi:hypothetical protein